MVKLRCKTPEVVRTEILAHLLAYKLLRTVMAVAADRERHRAFSRGNQTTGQSLMIFFFL